MRLTEKETKSICEAFLSHFSKNDHLWLFGSRVDDAKKGGDIDFYVETEEKDPRIALEKKLSFLNDLWSSLGEQKIDVVLNLTHDNFNLPIYQQAKLQGILLI
ncbi:MAG: nucleotidyltransferase domain-containing protein [Gammaproteobacteria bacterium]|jgi:predicted nucleotidyltransferase|nr:nucleotidyltransferase domain-containing protein [Gammaproteobacteria bacterium]